jgi:hypothetical protein
MVLIEKCSFKIVVVFLILLLFVQACGSSNVFYAKAESTPGTIAEIQTTAEIRMLEMNAIKSNKVVLKYLNEHHKVERFYKVSSDSVFFLLKNKRIVGYSIEEIKYYKISKEKSKPPVIGTSLLTASLIYHSTAYATDDLYAGIARFYGSIILGVISLGILAIEVTSTHNDLIYFIQSSDGVNISTANGDTVKHNPLSNNAKSQKIKEK